MAHAALPPAFLRFTLTPFLRSPQPYKNGTLEHWNIPCKSSTCQKPKWNIWNITNITHLLGSTMIYLTSLGFCVILGSINGSNNFI